MIKKLSVLLIITSITLYSSAAMADLTCKVNNIRVDTNSEEDCTAIGGKAESTYVFVINFDTGTYNGKKLRLNGNGSSNVIYFTENPGIKAGHMGVEKFKSLWDTEIKSFQADPPGAKLSLIIDGNDSDSIMTLSGPEVEDGSIIFDVTLSEGSPPDTFDTGGLFIDLLGSYAGPVSIYPQSDVQ